MLVRCVEGPSESGGGESSGDGGAAVGTEKRVKRGGLRVRRAAWHDDADGHAEEVQLARVRQGTVKQSPSHSAFLNHQLLRGS